MHGQGAAFPAREVRSEGTAEVVVFGLQSSPMLGSILGDIIGSVYEFAPIKTMDFPLFSPGCRFTDDTVLTVATMDCLLAGDAYPQVLKRWVRLYPEAGYGTLFRRWAWGDSEAPYGSWGNGAAMRIAPVAWAFDNLATTLAVAGEFAAATHDHPDAVRGAQVAAAAIYLARRGMPLEEIRQQIEFDFGYNLGETVEGLRRNHRYDVSCRGTVIAALLCVFEAHDWEDAIRNAVSLGGDADTLACIAGGIAEAAFRVPPHLVSQAWVHLDLKLAEVVRRFYHAFLGGVPGEP